MTQRRKKRKFDDDNASGAEERGRRRRAILNGTLLKNERAKARETRIQNPLKPSKGFCMAQTWIAVPQRRRKTDNNSWRATQRFETNIYR